VSGGASGGVLAAARARVLEGLAPIREELEAAGMPAPAWRGQLIRPLVGYASGVADGAEPGGPEWRALAAVQLAHEASLLHDDVVDGAEERRGEPTLAARHGVAVALVEGDHLLTSAYRLAAETGSLDWARLFARSVERTVAGEKAQARSRGRRLDRGAYESIVLGKSGELMGAALAAAPAIRGDRDVARYHALGRRVGLVYQMLDDLLDYCAHVETGKPSLLDYESDLWTWPRLLVDLPPGLSRAEVAERLHRVDADGRSGLDRCLEGYRAQVETVAREVSELLPDDAVLLALLAGWLRLAEEAVAAGRTVALPPVAGWEELMSEHAKSFRFASRLFPAERRDQVVGVYAWCRYTDDLVDGVDLPAAELEARLDRWLSVSRRAYDGEPTGNELADRVMSEMRAAGVSFGYAEELIEGMRMDVRGTEYGTLAELWTYTYRVASVVGLWMTELFGIRDPWMLERAASLGHAMQLTNILRDVGEDLEAGRLYLPRTWLRAYGLERADLERMARTGTIDPAYRDLVERLLRVAESEYDHAAAAVRRLPDFYRRPVAVAADVYRGIHGAIRRNGYDNLTRRAYTGLTQKLRLGAGALLRTRPSGAAVSTVTRAAAVFALVAAFLVLWPVLAGAQVLDMPGERGVVERVEPLEPVSPAERALAEIGRLWIRGVEDEDAVHGGLDAVAALESRLATPAPAIERQLRAYRGSFTTLLAKHGGWPRERLRNLREGFELMDAAVAEAPDAADVRYIRLMSGFYLPGIFGRGEEVERDLDALARLLPGSRDAFPRALYPEVVSFVLENGSPTPSERARLESLLR
jgi:phytoene synthase